MNRLSVLVLTAALLLTAALPARAQFKTPDVLSQVPESSAMVVVIPKLSDVNKSVGKFLKDFGGVPQEAHTPINALLEELGVSKGVDMDGSAALVMPTLQLMGEPRVYLILPVKDAVTFMTNFETVTPSEKSPDVLQIPFANEPRGFMKMAGKYAILSDNEQVVTKQAAPEDAKKLIAKAGALGQTVMGGADAILYLNMERVGPTLQPMVAMGMAQMIMQMENDPDMSAVMGGPEVAKAIMQGYQQVISTFLLQSQAVVLGGKVTDAGVTIRSATQFKPDSVPANMFKTHPVAGLNLDRLPNKPYMFAMAVDNTGIDWAAITKSLNEQIVAKMPEEGAVAELIKTYVDSMKVMDEFEFGQFAWYAGEAANPAPADMFNFAYVLGAKNPTSAYTSYVDSMKKMTAAAEKVNAELGEEVPKTTMKFYENDSEVDGHKIDRLEMKMAVPEGGGGMNPAGAMFAQPMNSYFTKTKDALIMAMSADKKLVAETIKASDGSGKLGSANELIALSRKGLPDGRFAEMYVDPAPFIKMWLNFMTMMMGGGGAQPEVPAMPPLAMSLTSKDGAMGLTYHAPMKLIHGVRDFAQNQGRGGGGQVIDEAGTVEAVEVADDGDGTAPVAAVAEAGKVVVVTDANFDQQVLKAKTPVLVDVWATWCGPCKKQSPIVEALAKDFKGQAAFAKLDADANTKTTEAYKVRALPTLLLFKDGKVVETFIGLTSEEKLAAAIRKHVAE